MIRIGNFIFHYRNGLFPLIYCLLIIQGPTLFGNYKTAAIVGFCVALLGQSIRAVTIGLDYIIRGGKDRRVYAERLVTGGIFNHCRNPLYLGNFIIVVGVAIAANSIIYMSIAIPFFIFAYAAIIAAEENFLRGKFGEEFNTYCRRVNRLLPNLSGLMTTLNGMTFNWRRLISAEYGSTYIWLAAITLVTLRNLWAHGDYNPNNPLVWTLWSCLGFVSLAYCLARFLKKTGRLNPPPVLAPFPAAK